jgi:triosephosphate isomerase
MLADLCQYVILGHSERRNLSGESNQLVNKKIKAAIKHGIKPILCVGENLAENEEGKTEAVVSGNSKNR